MGHIFNRKKKIGKQPSESVSGRGLSSSDQINSQIESRAPTNRLNSISPVGRIYSTPRIISPSRYIYLASSDEGTSGTSSSVTTPSILQFRDDSMDSHRDIGEPSPNSTEEPPLDEYGFFDDEIPPYRPTLHKYLDLISFDPRFAPVLRVNKTLVKNDKVLKNSIANFKKYNMLPSEVDLWKIHHVDDKEFDTIIPDLIPEPIRRDTRINQHLGNQRLYNLQNGTSIPFETEEQEIQYALYLSLLENTNITDDNQRRNYHGFRFNNFDTPHITSLPSPNYLGFRYNYSGSEQYSRGLGIMNMDI
ncbi:uncharacterized protein PRCAT00005490001 [Priceomyces carsonii]|uniref:uncharacterized protein n=1 Tax=Priceomyces carsonii TaxID=28549 RepID=UPI002ED7814E|nr:unnamed protein product [Priceomyces carsonii]